MKNQAKKRVVRGELVSLLIDVAKVIEMPSSKEQAEREDWAQYVTLDYARSEGGYKLVVRHVDGAGDEEFDNYGAEVRRSASEMKGYLQGIMAGYYAAKG